MNKYLIPICDIESGSVWIEIISARSISNCEDKIMDYLINRYEIDDPCNKYSDFVEQLDTNYNILIGDIQDIETI